MKRTIVSLFSGIGGLDLAAHWAGFQTVRFVEKEPFCQKVLAKHWPTVPIDDNVFTSHPTHADVVIGGFPCQPFSIAGLQKGASDERYLLPEMLRIVREVKPHAVVFENVPGFPALNDGAEFKYLLRSLAEMGFDAQWGHLRASEVGAPHRRERWFCVAYSKSAHDKRNSGAMGRSPANPWQQNDGHESECVGSVLEHTDRQRFQECIAPTGGSEIRFAAGRSPENVGNAKRSGLEGDTRWWSITQPANGHSRLKERQTQSRLGRTAYGIPDRLDFAGFPARPSQAQFSYEPPRTAGGKADTNARIKALGNAVVPQVAYPIFKNLMDWFEGTE